MMVAASFDVAGIQPEIGPVALDRPVQEGVFQQPPTGTRVPTCACGIFARNQNTAGGRERDLPTPDESLRATQQTKAVTAPSRCAMIAARRQMPNSFTARHSRYAVHAIYSGSWRYAASHSLDTQRMPFLGCNTMPTVTCGDARRDTPAFATLWGTCLE
jgi:hypothetical protein